MTINKAKAERATHFRKESPISAGRVRFISPGVQDESAGESGKPPTPKTYRGRLLNAQRSTSNFEYSAIRSATFRWIGRSEGDATAEAAKPLILSACGAVV